MSWRKKSAGFTILEVLMTIGILCFVLLMVTKLLTSYIRMVNVSSQDVDYTQNLRIASNQILNRINLNDLTNTVYDDTSHLLSVEGNSVLDVTTKRTDNPRDAELWLCDNGDSCQLKDRQNNVIANHIASIEVTPYESYLDIKIQLIDDADMRPAVLTVPLKIAYSSEIPDTHPNEVWENYLTYADSVLTIGGGSYLDAPLSTVYIKGDGTNFEMGQDGAIRAAGIYFEKNVTLTGNSRLGNTDGSSSIWINGNLTMQNSPEINGTTYVKENITMTGNPRIRGTVMYGGTLSASPNFIVGEAIHTTWTDFPTMHIPSVEPQPWYDENEYSSAPTYTNNMKYKGGSISFYNKRDLYDVTICSTGNISVTNGSLMSGILFAPNGTITIDASTFAGMLIGENVIIDHGAHVSFQQYPIDELPFIYVP